MAVVVVVLPPTARAGNSSGYLTHPMKAPNRRLVLFVRVSPPCHCAAGDIMSAHWTVALYLLAANPWF